MAEGKGRIVTSFSQVGQDLWVLEKLGNKRDGLFLDIGCGHPVEGNNTFLLWRDFNWNGISIDRDQRNKEIWDEFLRPGIIISNALDMGFGSKSFFDYLSLDIDDDQFQFVISFPWDRIRFTVMTIEHDSYRFGDAVRDEIRGVLHKAGYVIDRKDIGEKKFEDWWINPDAFK